MEAAAVVLSAASAALALLAYRKAKKHEAWANTIATSEPVTEKSLTSKINEILAGKQNGFVVMPEEEIDIAREEKLKENAQKGIDTPIEELA